MLDFGFFFGGFHRFLRMLKLVQYMHVLSPVDPGDEWTVYTRWDIAGAIIAATPFLDDQALLVTIARWESGFEPRYTYCLQGSSMGALGPFQVIPRSKSEEYLLCNNLKLSARLALQRIDESRGICAHLPHPERLAQYATGKCGELGKKMSKMRWSDNKKLMASLEECCSKK